MIHDPPLHLNGHAALLPPASSFNPQAVPAELRELCQWVVWRLEEQDGRLTKVPYTVAGGLASSIDPNTWAPFEAAVAAWAADDSLNGIGLVVTNAGPYTGIDLDGCIDDQGRLADEAARIVAELDSYTEVSPSKRGLRIFVRGRKPAGAKCKSKALAGFKGIEVYDHQRYFTVTGQRWPGTPPTVEDRQEALERLCGRLWPPAPPRAPRPVRTGDGFEGDDRALLDRMFSASNGPAIRRLFEGDTSGHADDDNAADLALCNHLAFWTGRNADRMDRLFRDSGLYRPKWDSPRPGGTYGSNTVQLAIASCQTVYEAPRSRPPPGRGGSGDPPDEEELGQPDPLTGRLILSQARTLPTARAYLRQHHDHPDGRTLHSYAGVPYAWAHNRYAPVEVGTLMGSLLGWLHGALRRCPRNPDRLIAFSANPTSVKQALDSILAWTHLPADTRSPSWLSEAADRLPASELLACRTVNLHLPTRTTIPATPALFTTSALNFDYDPDPEPPHRWIAFLEQILGEDVEAVTALQEWFGYCLTQDTSQQKILLIVGPPRSGKGTIARVLTELVGAGNVVGPTTGSLAGSFGLQPLIGKPLAIVSDARFSGENTATVIERLLCISGEDTLTIDRKHLPSVSMKLPTRFMVLTNVLPRLHDASSALPRRFVILQLKNSFLGREDPQLTRTLLTELPGILKWSLDGLDRLRARGHFVPPASSQEAMSDLEDLASPVAAFVRECCVVGPAHRAPLQALYTAWTGWCSRGGVTHTTTRQTFGRDLQAAEPRITVRRGTSQARFYEGIGLAGGVP